MTIHLKSTNPESDLLAVCRCRRGIFLPYILRSWLLGLVAVCLGLGKRLEAALPPDFPGITVTTLDTNGVAPGFVFLQVTDSSTNSGHYVMMLDNNGIPVWYRNVTNAAYDFKVLPDGYLHYA